MTTEIRAVYVKPNLEKGNQQNNRARLKQIKQNEQNKMAKTNQMFSIQKHRSAMRTCVAYESIFNII